ncbi:non-homologous end-joining DNA ligase [Senegalia massiliensis]|uniref:ATP-dependent DNA ligase n=1 Tax=Senegalia massiliensis TaxID=1720316 RepID=A0A845QZQ7_9CLOT|nr:non-homologous end-joining DNA ligase [Senegalia massiliensis]NBI07801.1 ATP-dependent DNA ligase [Senegalia massiliensis]
MKINNKNINIKNENKIIFPKSNISKKDLINYFLKISNYIIPHIENRPLTMHRFPNGINDINFYEKQIPSYFPSWFDRVDIKNKDKGHTIYPLCNNKHSLVYLANQACISQHIWLSKKDSLDYPDKIIFDLDPPENKDFNLVIKAAKDLKTLLDYKKLSAYVMTTGSKGLHIVVPIIQEYDFEETRHFSKNIAKELVEKNSDLYTIEQRKDKRNNKIFIDYLRNSYGQTSIAPYSIRDKDNAPIATPIDWDELDTTLSATKYNISNIFRRLGQKDDPWKNIYKVKNKIK